MKHVFTDTPRPSLSRPARAKNEHAEPEELDLYFLRAHAHGLLRRFLYASFQPCRVGSTLRDPVARGWVSSRPILTFDDAMLFVHDMEKCINALPSLDRDILKRHVLQEYTQEETAVLLGISPRAMNCKYAAAMDRLTAKLIEAELLLVPQN